MHGYEEQKLEEQETTMGMLRRTNRIIQHKPLVLALPKGRLLGQIVPLFEAAGYDLSPLHAKTRKLIFDCGELRVLILRSSDIPTYVEYGAADLGIAGRDVLDEQGRNIYEPLDLGIGACRLVVAEHSKRPINVNSEMHVRIATKYPVATRNYLQTHGLTAEVIKLSGAIELAPLLGLADRIVDLVESGETLRQNGLVEVLTIHHVTSRVVINPASLKLRGPLIPALIKKLEAAKLRRARTKGSL